MTYAEALIRKGKRAAAAFVQAECHDCCLQHQTDAAPDENAPSGVGPPPHLSALLDHLLHPEKHIDDKETIDWCKWLIGGGSSYEEFSVNVRKYDTLEMCGRVWTADFVAFRCRTCGISQCMSLCADCFKDGNHEGHDFNMFKSQAGGACDCGDASVMRPSGFCRQHYGGSECSGGTMEERIRRPPLSDLICVAEAMLPRIVLRLVQHLRLNVLPVETSGGVETSSSHATNTLAGYERVIDNADRFLKLLHDFASLGAAMRFVMTSCLVDKESYSRLTMTEAAATADVFGQSAARLMRRGAELYEASLKSLPNPALPPEFRLDDCPALSGKLCHSSFLEEMVFWTVKYEFPEKLVCLLLKLLPDRRYKEAFTKSFVLHYSRVSIMLANSSNCDKLSNRVVHVSVQLFSNEILAFSMTENLSLLQIMIASLKYMMSQVLIDCRLHTVPYGQPSHQVVDCSKHVMRNHCYWPLVSDLNNVLSHPPIAFKFMEDHTLLSMWFEFLQMFQGMNMNCREMDAHIEYEPNTYYASFSGELEASASPMWALVSHLNGTHNRQLTSNVLGHCILAIRHWFQKVGFNSNKSYDPLKVSFHIPLHRYFATFIRQAVLYQQFSLSVILPDQELLRLMLIHPLRVQVVFYEIVSGLWVRNGLQIKGQAMTYIQCHFCKSMVDADIYLLQLISTNLEPSVFLRTVLEQFRILDWLSLLPVPPNSVKSNAIESDSEQMISMMTSCITFISSLMVLRTNMGMDEEELSRAEMVSLLCMGDKTHSMLLEHIPEKYGSTINLELFDETLRHVAQYRDPQFDVLGGSMQQGMYLPKSTVWEDLYDPHYVLLRAVHRREFQQSLDRFAEFARSRFASEPERIKSSINPWPPWRIPETSLVEGFDDPRNILHTRYAHGLLFNVLYKCVYTPEGIPEHLISLTVFLIELAVSFRPAQSEMSGKEIVVSKPWLMVNEAVDLVYDKWFPSDYISANLRHTITAIFAHGDDSDRSASDLSAAATASDVSTQMHVDDPYEEGTNTVSVKSPNSSMISYEDMNLDDDSQSLPALMPPTSDVSLRHISPSSFTSVDQSPSSNVLESESSSAGQIRRSVIPINDSIISLLLRLHTKLSDVADSYIPLGDPERSPNSLTSHYRNSRIGNGSFFVEKLLDKISEIDEMCKLAVINTRVLLWPNKHSEDVRKGKNTEKQDMAIKRKKAQERKQYMMEQMASQQRRFMESAGAALQTPEESKTVAEDVVMDPSFVQGEERSGGADVELFEEQNRLMLNSDACFDENDEYMTVDQQSSTSSNQITPSIPLYDCVHCHQSTASCEERPMGLIVLMQSSSVLSNRRQFFESPGIFPTNEAESIILIERKKKTQESREFFESCLEPLSNQFDVSQYILTINSPTESSVHIQSCGHHVHLACRQSYMKHLASQQRIGGMQTLSVETGEYMCPMCRQLANCVLPIPVATGSFISVAKNHNLQSLLKTPTYKPSSNVSLITSTLTPLNMAMTTFMDQIHRTRHGPQHSNLGLFVVSVARTNLELDLVQRDGNLLQQSGATAISKQNNNLLFAALWHVLSPPVKSLSPLVFDDLWNRLNGIYVSDKFSSTSSAVLSLPIMLNDPIALLIYFSLRLPIPLDIRKFHQLVEALFYLLTNQNVLRYSLNISDISQEDFPEQRNWEIEKFSFFQFMLSLVFQTSLKNSKGESIFQCCVSDVLAQGTQRTRKDFEFLMQQESLSYLRIAALLANYLHNQAIPLVENSLDEFDSLINFLNISMKNENITKFEALVIVWCNELNKFAATQSAATTAVRQLICKSCPIWKLPQLLKLPKDYSSIFEFYHNRICLECGEVPKDPTVCLICGVIVCLKSFCCRKKIGNVLMCETVCHAINCGSGTGIFLAVNSSTIVVIRGKRACIWGSIYLDFFGEEDKELKRGKPLYLNEERYMLLQHQWLSHRFDHTNRKWIWHRDSL